MSPSGPSGCGGLDEAIATVLASSMDVTAAAPRLSGKRVLLRADLNLPMGPGHAVADTARLDAVLPTIQLLASAGAKVIVASHLGRPEPKKESLEKMRAEFSLAPVADTLAARLGPSVFKGLAPDCVGPEAEAAVAGLSDGQVLLLENTRFHDGDTSNDDAFASALASLCDVFVNDAFGVCHRNQASVTQVTVHVSECYAGPLLLAELRYLTQYLSQPVRPLGVVIGGSKVKDKIGVLRTLITKADTIIIGGRMAFTFLAALGTEVGQTQIEEDWLGPAREMVEAAKAHGVKLYLPRDVLVSSSLDAAEELHTVDMSRGCCTKASPCVPAGHFGVDIGPQSCVDVVEQIKACKTLLWNGPMGKYEVPDFSNGTTAVAKAFAAASEAGAITIIGGGDSVAAINQMGLASKMTHISTGGGASLELIEGRNMPGLRCLAGLCGPDCKS